MHNSKTHKPHRPRHKDVSKQHNSKPKKHHRKHHRSKNVLDPIQETSVEKIHVDQNACGDFAKDNVKNVAKDKHRRKKKVKKNSEKCKSEENNDNAIKDQNKHSENKKARKTSADIQKEDKKCHQDQSTTMKEEEIRKIVESNMKNYFAKFQHILDKKLDGFMQFAKKDNEKSIPKLDENEPPKSKTRESKRSDSADVKKERKYKDEIVNEVLKKLRKEERKT
ncbi:rRNA biogenesis protein RRP36-like [Sitophilus oryzae]|uniref:rRNA biogenesis protein RRP36-like n=1 Tax=Sitophilus oryzae TaxID=7048 RepID=A0A6J2XD25_SITOR|nr:rRNA biogenesis protein RRP36-like [Sitophilus oryzae]